MEIISKTKDNLGFEHSLFQGLNWKQPKTEKNFKNWKDEIITEFTIGINKGRVGTKYKQVTEKVVALKINQHPIYKEDKDECYKLLKTCREKHFGIFFWALKINK
jgi:hypothetical protein